MAIKEKTMTEEVKQLPPLTDEEQRQFDELKSIMAASNTCLIRTEMNGKPVAAVAVVNAQDGGDIADDMEDGRTMYNVTPVAILMSEDIFSRLENPMYGQE